MPTWAGIKNIAIFIVEPTNPNIGDIWIFENKKYQFTVDKEWVEIFTGEVFNKSGTLWTWGQGDYGVLGLGNVISRSSPVQVGSLSDWMQVAVGERHMLAIKTDGTLWAWGRGTYGRLGIGVNTHRSSPVQVGALTWKAIACTYSGSLAIRSDGTLWAWGYNFYSELGLNDNINRSSPVQVGTQNDWITISCGNAASFGMRSDGTLWAWGYNTYGRLGLNDSILRSSPTQIGSGTEWHFMDCQSGTSTTIAIRKDGTLWAWGYGELGQIGDNSITNRSTPIQIGDLSNWIKVFGSGEANCVALRKDGTLWTWGENYYGSLCLNDANHRSSPTQIGTTFQWRSVEAGTFMIDYQGRLFTCGGNGGGSLGINLSYTDARSSPIQVGSLSGWKKIIKGANSFWMGGPPPCSVAAIR
jgi:alpha-tubulin suppressor-like RCC1 family protein